MTKLLNIAPGVGMGRWVTHYVEVYIVAQHEMAYFSTTLLPENVYISNFLR